jgi:hypothetical protein
MGLVNPRAKLEHNPRTEAITDKINIVSNSLSFRAPSKRETAFYDWFFLSLILRSITDHFLKRGTFSG